VAEDLSQEAFARVYVVQDGSLRSPRSFLYRTAHNLAMDHMRHRRVAAAEPLDDVTADTLGDGRPTPDACVAAREELRLIEAAIEELPPKCRKVFIMLRFEERSYKEIALAMALSETMVRKYAMRALEHCRARLAEQKAPAGGAKSPGEIVESMNDSSGKR
jgi:RNA polymerase sigma-70 factor (ECF subfamily)